MSYDQAGLSSVQIELYTLCPTLQITFDAHDKKILSMSYLFPACEDLRNSLTLHMNIKVAGIALRSLRTAPACQLSDMTCHDI